jgi:tRNA(adenine34) deaminase
MNEDRDTEFMALAMEEAKAAAERAEVPIGAVLVDSKTSEIIARNSNRTLENADPTAHAEILVIRDGCQMTGAQRIPDCDLYVTLEPCAMCAAAISFARIRRVIFGAEDPKGGGILHGGKFFEQPTCHHRPKIASGFFAEESGLLLQGFFRARR